MRRLSSCNNRLYLNRLGCSGDAALKQSYLLFRLITAMSLPLGVIWLNSVLVASSQVLEFLAVSALSAVLVVGSLGLGGAGNFVVFDSRSGLMDKLNQYGRTVLGVSHEG
jgi:hypothetical protein